MVSRIHFTQELDELNHEVEEMGHLAREAIEKAVRLVVTGDQALREEVRDLDKQIYVYEAKIEKHCLDLIALHSPVAGDLRVVTTCWKMVEDLNRIGRYAWDIAEIAEVFDGHRFKRMLSIPQMATAVVSMVTDAVRCFTTRDASEAKELFERDDEVDEYYDNIFRDTLTYMFEDPKKITIGIHYILVARYLERVADHACNIGERVVYMATGERWDPALRKKKMPLGSNHNKGRPFGDQVVGQVEQGDYHQHELSEK